MTRKCDKCDKPAIVHSVEIVDGKKIEKHLCAEHAAEEGLEPVKSHKTINELLTNFVKGQSTGQEETGLVCDGCGMSFADFRQQSLLGCSQCYEVFEARLAPLLERAHDGGSHHVGRSPRGLAHSEQRQQELLRMRQRLSEAVAAEDFELAARLRDEIHRVEGHEA